MVLPYFQDNSPLPNSPIQDIVITKRDAQLLGGPAVSASSHLILEALSPLRHRVEPSRRLQWSPVLAVLFQFRCRLLVAEHQNGSDRNTELKRRLHLRDNSGTAAHRTTNRRKAVQPQTEEQRGKGACAFTARGSISKAMKRVVGGTATGSGRP